MFCRICGRQIDQHSAFCPYCGTKVESAGLNTQIPEPDADINDIGTGIMVAPYYAERSEADAAGINQNGQVSPYVKLQKPPMKRGLFILLTGIGSLLALLAGTGAGLGLTVLF